MLRTAARWPNLFSLLPFQGIYNLLTYKMQLWGTGKSTIHVGPDEIDDADEDLPHIVKTSPSLL